MLDTPLTVPQLGPGHIGPLLPVPSHLLGHKLVWSPPSSASTNTTIDTFINDLMNRALTGVSGTVHKVTDPNQINTECPENFNDLSGCFAAVVFDEVDISGHALVGLIHFWRRRTDRE